MSNFEKYTTENNLRQIYYNATTNRIFFTDVTNDIIRYVTPPSTSVTTISNVPTSLSITTNPSGSKAYTTSFVSPYLVRVTDISSGSTTELTTSGLANSTTHLVYDNSINCVWSQYSGSIYKITFDNITTPTTATNTLWWTAPAPTVYSLTRDYDNNVMYTVRASSPYVIYRFNPSDVSGIPQTIPFTGLTYTSIQPVLYYSYKRLFFAYKNTDPAQYMISYFDVSGSTYTLSSETIIATTAEATASLLSMTVDNNSIVYFVSANGFELYRSQLALCFNKGTKILCRNNEFEEYIAIDLLQIGDFVKTYEHGYKKITKVITGVLINNPKKWNMCMYKMEKTPTNGLIEDLIVTGGHSLLVDSISEEEQKKYDEMGLSDFSKITIDNKRLLLACVSDQFYAMQDNEEYTYYHLLLENNDDDERFGIWANGILTETPSKQNLHNTN